MPHCLLFSFDLDTVADLLKRAISHLSNHQCHENTFYVGIVSLALPWLCKHYDRIHLGCSVNPFDRLEITCLIPAF